MANYFTADSHFTYEDKKVLERDFRPFESVEEMNNKIIEIWNSQAGCDDIIYHLGDFINFSYKDYYKFEERLKFVQKIKAKVVLILGNNENRLMEDEFDNDFEKFRKYLLSLGFYEVYEHDLSLKIGDKTYYMTHLPRDCNKSGSSLFGHVHNSVFVKKYGFNVGVDNHYFKLFSEEEIINLENRREIFDDNVYE